MTKPPRDRGAAVYRGDRSVSGDFSAFNFLTDGFSVSSLASTQATPSTHCSLLSDTSLCAHTGETPIPQHHLGTGRSKMGHTQQLFIEHLLHAISVLEAEHSIPDRQKALPSWLML